MHMKVAIIPLLVLATFIITPSTALTVERKSLQTTQWSPILSRASITVGPYIMFPNVPVFAFNTDSHETAVFNLIIPYAWFSYTVVANELLVYGSGNNFDDKVTIFNATSQQTSAVKFGYYTNANAVASVGNKIIIAGGKTHDSFMDYAGVYDLTSQTITNYTLSAPTASMQSASVGNYAVFAGGWNQASESDDWIDSHNAFVFNTVTKTWTTTTINAFGDVQSVTIGQFAIFVCGNTADIFNSDTQSWSTHTLTQNASISLYGFSIAKTSRYVFFVGQGRADVFDSQTQTWSTLDIFPGTYATYCPSTTVDNYALFACHNSIILYDTATQEFVRRLRFGADNDVALQAGSVGKVATFFCRSDATLYIQTLDLTDGPGTISNRVITPTPVSVPFSTHQLTSPRPSHYSVANKAVFVNNDDKTVEIYDPETESWSTSSPDSNSRGSVLAAADDFLVFTDKTSTSMLHILDVESKSWSTTEVSPQAKRYLETAGNYLFYAGDYMTPIVAYDITNNTWIVAITYESWYYDCCSGLVPIKYKSYIIIIRPGTMLTDAFAWNTANGLERTAFYYGAGSSRLSPSYGIAGEYFVFAGGVYDNGYAPGFSIKNPETGYVYSGNMPTARYGLTILYAKPLVMFVRDGLIEAFNTESQQWRSSILDLEVPYTRTSVGNKLLMSYDGQTTGVEFDSTTQVWSNISFAGSRVGTVFKLRDVASFVDSDNMVIYDPYNQQHPWTKVQLSVSSGTRLTEAFVVGDKVIVVSSDDLTVRVGDFNQLSSPLPTPVAPVPSPSTPTPTTPQSSATPSSPSTPTTVPWSPWTAPVSDTPLANQPVSNSPSSVVTPVTPSSPSTSAPSTTQTPINNGNNNSPTVTGPGNPGPSESPVSSSSPTNSDSSPVTVAMPVSGSNLEATSSSSTISATAILSMVAVVLVFL